MAIALMSAAVWPVSSGGIPREIRPRRLVEVHGELIGGEPIEAGRQVVDRVVLRRQRAVPARDLVTSRRNDRKSFSLD